LHHSKDEFTIIPQLRRHIHQSTPVLLLILSSYGAAAESTCGSTASQQCDASNSVGTSQQFVASNSVSGDGNSLHGLNDLGFESNEVVSLLQESTLMRAGRKVSSNSTDEAQDSYKDKGSDVAGTRTNDNNYPNKDKEGDAGAEEDSSKDEEVHSVEEEASEDKEGGEAADEEGGEAAMDTTVSETTNDATNDAGCSIFLLLAGWSTWCTR